MRVTVIACLMFVLLSACHPPEETLSAEARALLWDFQEAHERGNYTRALALLDSILVLAPANPRLHFLRGDALATLYRFNEADEAFSRALQIDARYPSAAYRMGNNAFFLGQTREALAHYQREQKVLRSRDDSSSSSAVWAQIGRMYARLGVGDSARLAYNRAIRADATNDQAWGWMAELSEDTGLLEQALEETQVAIALDPSVPTYQYLAGALHFRLGEFATAAGHLESVIEAEPWHAGAHYNLGRSLVALGRAEEGARYLDETDSLQALQADIILAKFAARQHPQGRSEWIVLAMLYEQAGHVEEARQAYRIASQLESPN